MPKYSQKRKALLNNQLYYDILEKKGVKSLVVTRSINFSKLTGIEFDIMEEVAWKQNDSLYKLSYQYYGEYQYWWVIALFNNKPTDAHYKVGEIIYIPSNPIYIEGFLK